jgi:hypothetical protein
MPGAAIVKGVATLGGAVLGARANNKASEATERSTNQALAFEREKEARRRAEHDRYQAERMRQWNAFQAQRAGLLQRWGVPMGGRSMQQPQGASMAGARMPTGEKERVRLTLGDIARKY